MCTRSSVHKFARASPVDLVVGEARLHFRLLTKVLLFVFCILLSCSFCFVLV